MSVRTIVVGKSREPIPGHTLARMKTLAKERQIFGVPGASLTWGVNERTGGVVSAGAEGEKMTAKTLTAVAAEFPNASVFHSIKWPGSENGDTDHMLVVGRCVFVIDSKRWKEKRKYSVTPKGAVLRGTVPFPEGKVKILPAMAAWRAVLPPHAQVRGIVNIAQQKVFVPRDANWKKAPFRLLSDDTLHDYLRAVISNANPALTNHVDLAIVSPIMMGLIKPRDRQSEIMNMDAVRRMRA